MTDPGVSLRHAYSWENVPPEIRGLFVDRIPHDEKLSFMKKAIAEARRSPFHPSVGAVIVRDGEILATGRRDSIVVETTGRPTRTRSLHAEEMALRDAPERLEGATLYTTLEPCFDRAKPSFGQEIEACSSIVVRRGVRSVVIGLVDHELRNMGKGVATLVKAGVEVEFFYHGIERQLCALIGDGRFWHAAPGRRGARSVLRRLAAAIRTRI